MGNGLRSLVWVCWRCNLWKETYFCWLLVGVQSVFREIGELKGTARVRLKTNIDVLFSESCQLLSLLIFGVDDEILRLVLVPLLAVLNARTSLAKRVADYKIDFMKPILQTIVNLYLDWRWNLLDLAPDDCR